MMKSWNWISAIGRRPFIAAPMATPTISDSASGLSSTRASPNSFCNPSVTPKTPPLAPTSSPRIITRSSRCISSRIPSMYVFSATPVTRFRVHVQHRGVCGRQRRGLGLLGGLVELDHQLGAHLVRLTGTEDADLFERRLEAQQRVAFLVGLELFRRAIAPLVVIRAVRGKPEHLRLDERRAVAATSALHRLAGHPVAGDGVTAVHDHTRDAISLGAVGDVLR